MSGISRRSLIGYSGTAAAGAVLASGAAAEAAQGQGEQAKKAGATAQGAQAAASAFPRGTLFKGTSMVPGVGGEVAITFSVSTVDAPASYDIAPIELANALNKIAQDHGWGPITFYGTPAPAPLTQ